MPQKITLGYKALVEAAKAQIKEYTAEEAIELAKRPDVQLVDIRDPRELARDWPNSRRIPLPARHARILDRSGKPVLQADFR